MGRRIFQIVWEIAHSMILIIQDLVFGSVILLP
jgi:hypothetical protein